MVLGTLPVLALQFPAAWATPWLARATGNRLLLSDVQGTLWQGSAAVVMSGGPGSTDSEQMASRVFWRLGLEPGFQTGAMGVKATFTQDCCLRQPATLRWSPRQGGTLRIEGLDWQLPARLASGLGAPWNTLGFEGRLRIQAQALQWQQQAGLFSVTGQADLMASGLSSRLAKLKPLGSYRITLAGAEAGQSSENRQLGIQLSTLEGPLQLSGNGEWLGGRLLFRGEASAMAPYREELANVLNLIGNRRGPVTITTRR